MPCIYVLLSSITKKYYTGSTRDDKPDTRLGSHNAGRVKSTKSGKPWILIHTEVYPDYTSARIRELYLKSGKGREWIKLNFSKK